ncbi:MAG: hypothetical protein J7497_15910, partial [Chitinophagaceae bacterium]|nr:hypothetical protein [Chitinophagaceae bacterium]
MLRITFLTLNILLTSILFSQTNFSGSWKLEEKESIAGPDFANSISAKLVISQKKDSMIIESTTQGESGYTTTRSSFAMDGKTVSKFSAKADRKIERNLS